MRTILLILLFLVGALEISVGLLWGRLGIYALEAPFAQAIGLSSSSPDKTGEFGYYITVFKDQWGIVGWFGVATIFLALLLSWTERQRLKPPIPPSDAEPNNFD